MKILNKGLVYPFCLSISLWVKRYRKFIVYFIQVVEITLKLGGKDRTSITNISIRNTIFKLNLIV